MFISSHSLTTIILSLLLLLSSCYFISYSHAAVLFLNNRRSTTTTTTPSGIISSTISSWRQRGDNNHPRRRRHRFFDNITTRRNHDDTAINYDTSLLSRVKSFHDTSTNPNRPIIQKNNNNGRHSNAHNVLSFIATIRGGDNVDDETNNNPNDNDDKSENETDEPPPDEAAASATTTDSTPPPSSSSSSPPPETTSLYPTSLLTLLQTNAHSTLTTHSHPKHLLHSMAPKIRAIRQSPDYLLRITSASVDDASLAAKVLGVLAEVTEELSGDGDEDYSADLIGERRLEQLVECVLCGLIGDDDDDDDTTAERRGVGDEDAITSNNDNDSRRHITTATDDDDDSGYLSVSDASRAAWGLSVLGIIRRTKLAGESHPPLILHALSRHCERRLSDRWKTKRRRRRRRGRRRRRRHSTDEEEETMRRRREGLIHDTADVLWSFGVVAACSGVRNEGLMMVCGEILGGKVEDYYDGRDDDGEEEYEEEEVMLDRLAKSEEREMEEEETRKEDEAEEEATTSVTVVNGTRRLISDGNETNATATIEDDESNDNNETDFLLNSLSPKELANIAWALGVHDAEMLPPKEQQKRRHNKKRRRRKQQKQQTNTTTTATTTTFLTILSHRIQSILSADLHDIQNSRQSEKINNDDDDTTQPVEVVDAASLLSGSPSIQKEILSSPENNKTVEVIDAASLLSGLSTSDDVQKEVLDGNHTIVVDATTLSESDDEELMTDDEEGEQSGRRRRRRQSRRQKESTIDDTLTNDDLSNSSPDSPTTTTAIHPSSHDIDNTRTNTTTTTPPSRRFTPHDSCSILWAFVALEHDSSSQLTSTVVSIFDSTRPYHELNGADLCNLLWSMAAQHVVKDEVVMGRVAWNVAGVALERMTEDKGYFEPVELGRLMWSLAVLRKRMEVAARQGEEEMRRWREVVGELAGRVMMVMAEGDMFKSLKIEDMAHLPWTFTELTDLTNPIPIEILHTLGRIFTIIEFTMIQWQHQFHTIVTSARNPNNDDDDDDDLSKDKKAKEPPPPLPLPLSTLAKTVGAYYGTLEQTHHIAYSNHDNDDLLTIVINHLMTSSSSSSSQLSSLATDDPRDIILLCHACSTTTKRAGFSKLFLPQLVNFLNDETKQHDVSSSSSFLERLGSDDDDVASFWRSLGVLMSGYVGGAGGDEEEEESEVDWSVCLPKAVNLEKMSDGSLLDMLKGAVILCDPLEDSDFLRSLLSEIDTRILQASSDNDDPNILCDTITNLLNLLNLSIELQQDTPHPPPSSTTSSTTINEITDDDDDDDETTPELSSSTPSPNNNDDNKDNDESSFSSSSTTTLSNTTHEDLIIDSLSPTHPYEQITTLINVVTSILHRSISLVTSRASSLSSENILLLLRTMLISSLSSSSSSSSSQQQPPMITTARHFFPDQDRQRDAMTILQQVVKQRLASLQRAHYHSSPIVNNSGAGGDGDGSRLPALMRRSADAAVDVATLIRESIPSLVGIDDDETELKQQKVDKDKNGGKRMNQNKDNNDDDDEQNSNSSNDMTSILQLANRSAAYSCEAAAMMERLGRGMGVNPGDALRWKEEELIWLLGRCDELLEIYFDAVGGGDGGGGKRRWKREEEEEEEDGGKRRVSLGKRLFSRLFR